MPIPPSNTGTGPLLAESLCDLSLHVTFFDCVAFFELLFSARKGKRELHEILCSIDRNRDNGQSFGLGFAAEFVDFFFVYKYHAVTGGFCGVRFACRCVRCDVHADDHEFVAAHVEKRAFEVYASGFRRLHFRSCEH